MNSLIAELMLLRKRVSVYILLGFWLLLTVSFAYILPYYAYKGDIAFREHGGKVLLANLLPSHLVSTLLPGFPFFGGTIVLILAVLAFGSEFSWGTLTTIFTQRASRMKIFFSKLGALAIAIIPFVVLAFLLGYIASTLIAWGEGQSMALPPAWDLARALAATWFIMAVWAAFGVVIAVISRGTALAIGLGIIYGLVLEGVIAGFANQITVLGYISKAFLRTNGYSLLSSLGATVTGEGPGAFSGKTVSALQAGSVLGIEAVVFVAVAAVILRWRDVAG